MLSAQAPFPGGRVLPVGWPAYHLSQKRPWALWGRWRHVTHPQEFRQPPAQPASAWGVPWAATQFVAAPGARQAQQSSDRPAPKVVAVRVAAREQAQAQPPVAAVRTSARIGVAPAAAWLGAAVR